MDNIDFHCPEFNLGINFYQKLIELEFKHPEYFNPEAKIKTIYGDFPNMIWNGGGIYTGVLTSIEEAEKIKNFYYQQKIPLQLTLTNPLITEKDCYDRYCNKIVEIFENDINMILVSSPILEEYLRDKYPKYKFCKSIIASEYEDNYEDELNKYEYIVLPRRKIKDFNFLNTIKEENRHKFEILCNDPCPIDCPRLYSHYKDYAQFTLFEEKNFNSMQCTQISPDCLRTKEHLNFQISYQDILSKYLPIGYNSIKIGGRGNLLNVIFSVVKYFIKEDFKYDALFYFLKQEGYN